MTDERLDRPCGRHFTFRALIEAGETWQRVRVPNLPIEPHTWTALTRLATDILDPIEEQFGRIDITYGFASPALTRHIPGRIDPSRDQHAGHELRRDGRPVCPRLGQAVDFRVGDACSGRMAAWIVAHLPFDRLYFYGSDKPLHVSIGPDEMRAIVTMIEGPSGRRVPQRKRPLRFTERYGS